MSEQLFLRVDGGNEAKGGLAVPSHSLPLSLKSINITSGEDFLKIWMHINIIQTSLKIK